jgi:hypothetical protein
MKNWFYFCFGKIKKEMIVVGILMIITVLFFWRGILFNSTSLIWDLADYFYPLISYNAAFIDHGIMPLWNPMVFNGYPSFADPQIQTFYPINVIAALFFKFTPKVVYCLVAFHFFLAGVFMFFLCRNFKYDYGVSLFGAVSFMFSGFLVGHFQHLTMICSIAYLPVLFLCFDKALDENSTAYALLGALFLGLCILAGHPQTYFYICFAISIHWGYKLICIWQKKKELFFDAIKKGFIFFGFGIILAMIQLIPTLEFMRLSNREAERILISSGLGIKWTNMITLFIPDYFGGISAKGYFDWNIGVDISQQNLYMGVLTIFLAVFAVAFSKNGQRWYFTFAAITALIISMGINTPLFSILFKFVPGFSLFRHILHLMFLFHFFVAILSAEGLRSFINRDASLRAFSVYVLLFAAFVFLFHLAMPAPPEQVAGFATPQKGLLRFFSIYIGGVAILFFYLYQKKEKLNWLYYFLFIVLFCDLAILTSRSVTIGGNGNNKASDKSYHEIFEQSSGICQTIQRDAGLEIEKPFYNIDALNIIQRFNNSDLFRIYVSTNDRPFMAPDDTNLLHSLGFNRPILHSMFLVDGYSPMVLKRHFVLSEYVGGKNLERLVELCNAKYNVVDGNPKIMVKMYKKTLKRAMILDYAEFLEEEQSILERLADSNFDPNKTILIEGKSVTQNVDPTNSLNQNKDAKVQITNYLPNRIELSVESAKASFLLLNETYYPGWRAYVDDQETEVLKANYNFKAIKIQKGQHKVSFVFKPVSLKIGASITCAALLVMLVGWFNCYKHNK